MLKRIVLALKENESPYLFTDLRDQTLGNMASVIRGEAFGDRSLIPPEYETIQKLPCVQNDVLIEQIQSKPELILCGGGHVSVQTAKIAKLCNFSVTVIDPRADFANAERFPLADRIINLPFSDALNQISCSNPFFVIVTRGHLDDRECLELILKKPFTYCGMIGSKKKVELVRQQLLKNGYSEERIERVHAPIGIAIGANTPEEIAVSIVGQMIQCKNQKQNGVEWDDDFRNAIMDRKPPYAVVTLISKSGSAPRSTGARMIVMPDGEIISSIGGGYGEYEAQQYALSMLNDPTANAYRYLCRMTNEDAAQSGMICGGKVDVLIKIVR